MDVPIVTADLVRLLRAGYPNADLVYAGGGRVTFSLDRRENRWRAEYSTDR